MKRLSINGQSIIEYVVIFTIVAVAALIFTTNFIKSGDLNLFTGFVASAKANMRPQP